MDKEWDMFEKSGKVEDYLKYVGNKKTSVETVNTETIISQNTIPYDNQSCMNTSDMQLQNG